MVKNKERGSGGGGWGEQGTRGNESKTIARENHGESTGPKRGYPCDWIKTKFVGSANGRRDPLLSVSANRSTDHRHFTEAFQGGSSTFPF